MSAVEKRLEERFGCAREIEGVCVLCGGARRRRGGGRDGRRVPYIKKNTS